MKTVRVKTVGRLITGVVALALLLGGFGLMQDTAQAQDASVGTIELSAKYVCSSCEANNISKLDVADGAGGQLATGNVEVLNLDVAEVDGVNPKTIGVATTIKVVQEFSSPAVAEEIRGFNGNRIRVRYSPTNAFGTTAIILVDNVNPTLVTLSPDIPLVVKGNTNVTFSAEITDGGAGYTGTNTSEGGIHALTSSPGILVALANDTTEVGGVRLVVAGNVVPLGSTNFEDIDGGWRVSAELDSTDIQNIGANVPWYFETRDRAGNMRRTSGSVAVSGAIEPGSLTGTAPDTTITDATVTDTDFIGGLPTTALLGSSMKVTRGSQSKTVPMGTFDMVAGKFTLGTLNVGNFFIDDKGTPADATDDEVTPLTADDTFELVGSNLLSIDSVAPSLVSGGITTGITYSTSAKAAVRGLNAKANSIQVKFEDDGKVEGDKAGSGLDAASVTASAFTVSGNTVTSVLVMGKDVYLTLADGLAPDEQPSVTIASGLIMDKAGNAFGGERVSKAGDGLGPNLSLSEDSDLSGEKVTVTISTDEQLASLPTVVLSRVIDSDGGIVGPTAKVCDLDETAETTELIGVPELGCGSLDVTENLSATPPVLAENYTEVPDPRRPNSRPSTSQTAALSYSYAATTDAVNPVGQSGGKYNVYVTGVDTQHLENMSKIGHKDDANHSAAFTFQLDTALNGGVDPIVTVSDETAASGDADVPDVQAIEPMIITVDFAGEAGEYPGDSYSTVTLTSAELSISFSDGSSDSRTFDLATEVSTQDSRKYTIPLLNPKVGTYTLTVKGEDSADNASGTDGHSASWEVVAAKPVSIGLKPGWNLISLPFQPANPAINSVIPSDHPIGLVMTFDGAEGVWLFSRRDAETGLFIGDVAVMTATNAYFVNTDSFQALSLFRPPSATAAAAPAQPPAIGVSKGWNLVPVSSNQGVVPKGVSADTYFGTLGASWLRALAWDPLARTWLAVSPGSMESSVDPNPVPADETRTDRCGTEHSAGPVGAQVCTGEGLWLWVTEDGTLIPG